MDVRPARSLLRFACKSNTRQIVLLAATAMVLVVAACGSDDTESTDAGPQDAGPACQEACQDAFSVEHLIDHLVGDE